MGGNESIVFKTGTFSVSSHTQLSGTLSLNGRDSELHLWANNMPYLDMAGKQEMTGVLDSGEKVSLVNCGFLRGTRGHSIQYGNTQHWWYFPGYATIGPRCFSPSENDISYVTFVVDDAGILFHDRKSYGTLILKAEELEHIQSIESFSDIPFTVDNPVIAYFTGKLELFSAETDIGRISARHSPSFDMGGPSGAYIENRIYVFIEFDSPVNIHEMDRRLRKVIRFFEIIVGRPQNLVEVNVKHVDDGNETNLSSTYINGYPNQDRHTEGSDLHYYDVLTDAVEHPDEFARLIISWLKRDEMWHDARMRFSWGWNKQRSYDADRIVGAANMFDLIPSNVFPKDVTLPCDLEVVVQECNRRFKSLPKNPKRDAVLSVLGNIRKPSLKEKIRHRVAKITSVIGNLIPEIELVTDRAVDLRNLYVHGDKSGRRKERSGQSLVFLTNTLEFVYCVSDLMDSGWDLGAWVQRPKVHGHPFTSFLIEYNENLSRLRKDTRD